MNINLILTIGLIILPLIWTKTDPRPIKDRLKQYLSFKSMLLLVIEIGVIYLNLAYSNTIVLSSPLNILLLSLGVILYIAGLVLAVWAKITMGNIWGTPAQHNFKRQKSLITSGPFKFTRNPIYLGLITTYIGYSLALKSIFIIFNVLIIGFFYFSALKEEKLLEKYFGKKYLQYKLEVPRFF